MVSPWGALPFEYVRKRGAGSTGSEGSTGVVLPEGGISVTSDW